jgi:iron complex outermembrane recepter protein
MHRFKYVKCSLVVILMAFSHAIKAQTISGTVTSKSKTIKGVMVNEKGTINSVPVNGNGTFAITVASLPTVLVVGGSGFIKKEVAVAAEISTLSIELETESAQVIVVGSRSRVPRSSVQTAVPVDAFSAKELATTGQLEPTQMINFVAPSFNSARQTITDGTDHIDPATLRGLGPDQVLVLINGKRRHSTALVNVNGSVGRGSVGTDLNAIPPSAIERIEVLRDGAAAQYGSDAIAGVINVVLKKDVKKGGITAQIGQTAEGDGEQLQLGANYGFKLGKKGFLNATADVRSRMPTNRAGAYNGLVYLYSVRNGASFDWYDRGVRTALTTTTNSTTDAAVVALDNQLVSQRNFDRSDGFIVGNAKLLNFSSMINGEVGLGNNTTFYFSTGASFRDGRASGFYRYPSEQNRSNYTIYPDGFLPFINTTIWDKSLIAGIRTEAKGWEIDFSNTIGGNSVKFDIDGSMNASLLPNNRDSVFNPREFYSGTLVFNQNTTNLGASKDFGSKVGLKSFNVATGLEFRYDNYKIKEGEEKSWKSYNPALSRPGGAQVFPGFQPANAVNAKRTNIAAYVELESDITKSWLVSAAGRFENYSDFGSNFSWKFATRYTISNAFTLRGAISTGFRAPSLHQGNFSAISTVTVNTATGLTPVQQGTFRNNSDVAKAFGIPELKQETSVNASIGFTSKIGKNFTATVDAYQVNIKDRIVLTGQFLKRRNADGSLNLTDKVTQLLAPFPDSEAAIFFTNAVSTTTQGIDAVLNYTGLKAGKGIITFTLAGNFNKTEVDTNNIKASTQLTGLQSTLFNKEEIGRFEVGQPRSKVSFNANYRIKRFGINTRITRFGEVASIFNSATDRSRDQTFSPKIVTDANISYLIGSSFTVMLGANNLFDVYPDKIADPRNTSNGRFVYSRSVTQFGYNGAYYYLNLAYNF